MKKNVKEIKDKAMNSFKRAAFVGAGAIAGKIINDFIQKKSIDTVSGQEVDLLGLSGKWSKFTTPAIILAAGAVGNMAVKGQGAKDVTLGVLASGAVSMVQAISGKNFSNLQGVDEPVEFEGINGYAPIPGIGTTMYDELPSANEAAQQYIPEINPSNEMSEEMAGTVGELDDEDLA